MPGVSHDADDGRDADDAAPAARHHAPERGAGQDQELRERVQQELRQSLRLAAGGQERLPQEDELALPLMLELQAQVLEVDAETGDVRSMKIRDMIRNVA